MPQQKRKSTVFKPLTMKIDTSQLEEAFRKLAETMKKSGKTLKILGEAMASSMIKGVAIGIQFDNQMLAVEAFAKFEERWVTLLALGWIRDPEGGLVSPNTLDIVDPSILNNAEQFKLFLDCYLATGTVAKWVPCWYAVTTEEIALPLDSVRKQLKERISTETADLLGPTRIGE